METSEEFGSQGELPSHPELLDYLAVDLMENGWDLKRLVKQIVMSQTYRQASDATPEMLEFDPANRYLREVPDFAFLQKRFATKRWRLQGYCQQRCTDRL